MTMSRRKWIPYRISLRCVVAVASALLILYLVAPAIHGMYLRKYLQLCGGKYSKKQIPKPVPETQRLKYLSTVQRYSTNNLIYLMLVDSGVVSMAWNFYKSSLQKHNIQNYLFISTDPKACIQLQHLIPDVHCFFYGEDEDGHHDSLYGSTEFYRKMNMRVNALMDALSDGIQVIASDVDIVYLQRPDQHIFLECKNAGGCDIAALWDSIEYNAGFVFLNNTWPSTYTFKLMKESIDAGCTLNDQALLSMVIESGVVVKLRTIKLSTEKFLNGVAYFEDKSRLFFDEHTPCKDCVVVHNNFIVGTQAKIYRFQELHLWQVDTDGYYSNPQAKYLAFDSPLKTANFADAAMALRNALVLSHLLNRTLILPQMLCPSNVIASSDSTKSIIICPFISYISMSHFHNNFKGLYRESSFLSNPLVPLSVKTSMSTIHLIKTESEPGGEKSDFTVLKSRDLGKGPTEAEISQWLGHVPQAVLRIHSTNGERLIQENALPESNSFISKLKEGFVKGDYRQLYIG